MYSVKLDNDTIGQLIKPVNGSGGYQSLMRKLQAQYNHINGILEYNDDNLKKLKKCDKYCKSGFRGSVKAILLCIEK